MNWFPKKVKELSSLSGYIKPENYPETLKLDSNENFVISKQFQQDLLNTARKNSDVREYPLDGTERLVKELSKYLKIPSSMIGVGNGSDQILDLILCNFASKKTKVLTSDPTFGFFEERCKLYSIPTIKIPFSYDMTLNADKFFSQLKKADILYLDSPNNPTGYQFPRKILQQLIKEFDGLVIVDEAYVAFGDYSLVNMTKSHSQTCSPCTISFGATQNSTSPRSRMKNPLAMTPCSAGGVPVNMLACTGDVTHGKVGVNSAIAP